MEPLASRLRPQTLDDYVGQDHLLAYGKALRQCYEDQMLHSMILWGPPGTGKTTLGYILTQRCRARWVHGSAVMMGVKDLRQIIDKAYAEQDKQATVLFLDEIHRFNKSQQDALLPHVESGLLTLIGATTENPSFALNNALLSRAQVYALQALQQDDLQKILHKAQAYWLEFYGQSLQITDQANQALLDIAAGDGRQLLNYLERALGIAQLSKTDEVITVDLEQVQQVLAQRVNRFDRDGDYLYDTISALHKSIRGSNPDAALYWLARMLVGGTDPLYIARRLVRTASEDIGNADPRALNLALNAWQVQERLGSPEGELAIAQATVYLACAAKSNAVYQAFNQAYEHAQQTGDQPVPVHLRQAPTKLMKQMGYGKDYRYAHNEPHAYAAGENYFPEQFTPNPKYYRPTDRGLEKRIQDKLAFLKQLDDEHC